MFVKPKWRKGLQGLRGKAGKLLSRNKKARFDLDSLSFANGLCALYPNRRGKDGRLMSGRISAERPWPRRQDCLSCGKPQKLISQALGVCVDCLRMNPESLASHIESVHEATRRSFGLPPSPPQDAAGTLCNFCIRACRIPEGQLGYCATRRNHSGKIVGGKLEIPCALLAFHPNFYMDDLPTTSRSHALECFEAAREAGLKRVRLGNLHLISANG